MIQNALSSSSRPHDIGWFGLFVGVGGTGIVFLLQSNGVTPNWWLSAIGYAVFGGLIFYSFWKHAFPAGSTMLRSISLLFLAVSILALGGLGTYKQYLREQEELVLPTDSKGAPDFARLMAIPPIELDAIARLPIAPLPSADAATLKRNARLGMQKALFCLEHATFIQQRDASDSRAYQRLLAAAKELGEAEHQLYVGVYENGNLQPARDNALFSLEGRRASAIRQMKLSYTVIKPEWDMVLWAYAAMDDLIQKSAANTAYLGTNHSLLADFNERLKQAIHDYSVVIFAANSDPNVSFSENRHSPETTSLAYYLERDQPLPSDMCTVLRNLVGAVSDENAKSDRLPERSDSQEGMKQRRITPGQRQIVLERLRKSAPLTLAIRCNDDDESIQYANDFADVFRNGGWSLREPQLALAIGKISGVAILVPKGRPPEGAKILWKALINAKIEVDVYAMPELAFDSFELAIGEKEPNPKVLEEAGTTRDN
jgi:hypothetical protein